MSFLTQCFVWEASVQNQFKSGKIKVNEIWKHAISKNCFKFQGFTALGILAKIQNMIAELRCELEQFQGRIIFMPVFNDIF